MCTLDCNPRSELLSSEDDVNLRNEISLAEPATRTIGELVRVFHFAVAIGLGVFVLVMWRLTYVCASKLTCRLIYENRRLEMV